MNVIRRARGLRTVVIIAGVLLLIVNVAGITPQSFLQKPATWNTKGIAGYDFPLLNENHLLKLIATKSDTSSPSFLADVTNAVYFGTYHTENRNISFTENWLLWLAAKFYSPFGRTQDAERVVRGRAGNCSERVQVLMEIYKRNGIDAQVLLLNGHVALQAFFRKQWIITDPDFGLVRDGDIQMMRSAEGLAFADSFLVARGFNQQVRDYYLYAWRVTSDDKILAVNQYTNTRLFYIEKITQWLRWLAPLFLICIGVMWPRLFSRGVRNHSTAERQLSHF